jgi:hypothetical protein
LQDGVSSEVLARFLQLSIGDANCATTAWLTSRVKDSVVVCLPATRPKQRQSAKADQDTDSDGFRPLLSAAANWTGSSKLWCVFGLPDIPLTSVADLQQASSEDSAFCVSEEAADQLVRQVVSAAGGECGEYYVAESHFVHLR